ncbi:sensor histidine kinase [Nonomuraea maritima]|uniref:sensor histidine kinase n=1 Tax=Nonomuraea maritima TaxID=683260 RepID=UPI003719DF0F
MDTWRRISITKRITLFGGVLAVLLSAALAVVVLTAVHRYATESRTEEIAADGGRVVTQVERQGPVTPLVHHSDRKVQIVDPRGRVVAATPQLRGRPVMADPSWRDMRDSAAVVCGGAFPSGECNIVVARAAHRDGQVWTVLVAAPVVPPYVVPWLAVTVAGAAAALAAAVTVLAHRIVTDALRPVTRIQTELDRMNDAGTDDRLPVPGSHDEIQNLAESVNRTLVRLHAAMAQQRHFTSDASHELRTPIAAIRAEVEDAMQAPEESSIPTLGAKVLNSVDRLQAIVDGLLTIARLESGRPVEREPTDLAELVTARCRERESVTGKAFTCSLEPGVTVLGDRTELSRLLANLIDNAERYACSSVSLNVRRLPSAGRDAQRFPDGVALVEVIDDGPGIELDKRELVFQRFARLDTARDRDAGGTGLGLAIARQIAFAHGGTLLVEDAAQGAHLVLRLPLHPDGSL